MNTLELIEACKRLQPALAKAEAERDEAQTQVAVLVDYCEASYSLAEGGRRYFLRCCSPPGYVFDVPPAHTEKCPLSNLPAAAKELVEKAQQVGEKTDECACLHKVLGRVREAIDKIRNHHVYCYNCEKMQKIATDALFSEGTSWVPILAKENARLREALGETAEYKKDDELCWCHRWPEHGKHGEICRKAKAALSPAESDG